MKKCLLIPGNPAVAGYYQSWIQEIESQFKSIDMVYATSYVLFDRKLTYIEYEIAMLGHYEKLFLGLNPSEKVVIVAHSVGSYFALKLLEKYPDKIEKVIVMFPYLGYSTIKSLRFTWLFYSIDRYFPFVELVVRCKKLFQKWDKEVKNISNYELTACLRFGFRQCTYFNKYKFNTNNVSVSKDKIYFIYKNDDKWCPKPAVELLKPFSHYKEVDIPHDFIVEQDQRKRMTNEIMPLIES